MTAAVDVLHYAPEFRVTINGGELTAEMAKTIQSIRVEQELNTLNDFSFEVQDEIREGQFRWLGHPLFKYGNNVSLMLGYASRLFPMLEGKMQNINARFFEGTSPSFTIEGSDEAYKLLTTNIASEEFVNLTDSQIAEEVARRAHLRPVVERTELTRAAETKEGGVSYFSFLQRIARRNSFEVRLSGRELYFGSGDSPVGMPIPLTWGENLKNFTPELNTSQAVSEVVVQSWDRTRRQPIEGRARAGEEGSGSEGNSASQVVRQIYGDVVEVVTDHPVASNQEAREHALSVLRQRSASLLRASGETIGMPEMKPGSVLVLTGLGQWFSGNYSVEKVTHAIDSGGYRTSFTASRNFL